jgi:catechol 2,3-dioxygenase-like lactoylglutathione lyase family enzyme
MISGIRGLHHFAWRCRDAEETRHFYEDVLGLPLAHVIKSDYVPSTGEYCPYVHIFFRMDDGSFIAFFDLGDNKLTVPDTDTPAWVNHIAFEVADNAELERLKSRLQANSVEVVGITDHHFVRSIYFFDPNGFRLEFTARQAVGDYLDRKERSAHQELLEWQQDKAAGLRPLEKRKPELAIHVGKR